MDRLSKLFPKWLIISLSTIVLGIVFIAIFYSSDNKSKVVEILGTIGKTILGSGVFLLFLKSIQFLGVFQDEIRKVIYSDEILTKRNDIQEIWKKVTRAVYQSAFPSISSKIEDLIQDKILPRKLNYYHKDLHVIYEIDKVDDNHFGLIESQSFIIISDGKDITFEFKNHYIKTTDESDKSDLTIDLLINNENYNNKIIKSNQIAFSNNQIGFNFYCSLTLKGNTEYHVKKVTKSIHTTRLNGYWNFGIGRITDSFTIDIRNNGNYEVDLIPFGNNTSLQKIFVSSTLNINKHYDILTPGDGYILLIKSKFE